MMLQLLSDIFRDGSVIILLSPDEQSQVISGGLARKRHFSDWIWVSSNFRVFVLTRKISGNYTSSVDQPKTKSRNVVVTHHACRELCSET